MPNAPCDHGFTDTFEQAIQQDMEDNVDKGGGNKDFEEKLAEALFADDGELRMMVCSMRHQGPLGGVYR
jgi:hypothetical protein